MKRYWPVAGIAAVAVVAAIVVLVLSGGSDASTPEGAAEAAVEAFADKDSDALADILCADVANPLDQVAPSPLVGAELGEVRMDGADNAVAAVTVTYSEDTTQTEMGLANENGAWCLSWFGS